MYTRTIITTTTTTTSTKVYLRNFVCREFLWMLVMSGFVVETLDFLRSVLAAFMPEAAMGTIAELTPLTLQSCVFTTFCSWIGQVWWTIWLRSRDRLSSPTSAA